MISLMPGGTMKLQHKTFIIIGLATLLFIFANYFPTIRLPFLNFVITTCLYSLSIICLIYAFVIGQIEKLNKKTYELFTQQHLIPSVSNNDEIAMLLNYLHELTLTLEEQEALLQKQDKEIDKLTQQLQQKTLASLQTQTTTVSDTESLTPLGRYDTLTTLPNRVFFNEILNKTMSHAKRRNKIVAVLLVDVDSFKEINKKFGQAVGDEVLKKISVSLSKTLRAEDILARLDGDEFIILLNDIGKPKFASSVAEKVLAALSQPFIINSETLSLSASIGIAIYPDDGLALEELLKSTDSALLKAKQQGGNTYQFYTHEMSIEAHEHIKLETALRNAIQYNDLTLYYQPKLHIKRGAITGVEALIRWSHPDYANISPAKLVSLAEETGLIMQLGEWVLREACRANKFWQDEGYEHITVAVNISPKQFHHPDLPQLITKVLNETGLNPSFLELEINETTAMNDVDAATKSFERIKATGVQLSIDHFGMGYISISHIKQFPVSTIKIDQSFIKGIPQVPNDMAITNAFIALAHQLGLEVVAEGIETAEQVQYLAEQNCDIVQGYFLSHPLPAQKITGQFTKLSEEVLI